MISCNYCRDFRNFSLGFPKVFLRFFALCKPGGKYTYTDIQLFFIDSLRTERIYARINKYVYGTRGVYDNTCIMCISVFFRLVQPMFLSFSGETFVGLGYFD